MSGFQTLRVSAGALGSSISIGEIEGATLVIESEGIASNDNDTTIPTSAAVKDYTDNAIPAAEDATGLNTGTATDEYATADAIAGSYAGIKSLGGMITDGSGAIATGDGQLYIRIPSDVNGMNLVGVAASVTAPSTSGTIDVQVARGRQAAAGTAHAFVDMLSTKVTIDANEYDSKDATTAAVINTSNDDVATGDLIRIDVDSVGSGPTAVLSINLQFQLP